ncbi:glycosyltransferase [Lichenicoccus sp.]|uniref:glycosyltransferase n=1 Tax=Lichenicoccus sp. TaxID=2781899 RepID=UPI003D0A969D
MLRAAPETLRAGRAAPGPELSIIVPCYNERQNVAVLAERIADALEGVRWEIVFVDDNSPDGTAAAVRALARNDARIRCLRRVGRRGLASAVIEGALSSSADTIAVIDGDLQHDETRLPEMLRLLAAAPCDVVIASRYAAGGNAEGLGGNWRHRLSEAGIRLAQALLRVRLTDPMSGFFMIRNRAFEGCAERLTGQGFKILLDLLLSDRALRVREIPAVFHERVAGKSKLDVLVLAQFAALLLDKALGGVVPLRFIGFAAVGAIGILVNVGVLVLLRDATGMAFGIGELIATLVAMITNFQLNNRITYRDQALRGRRLWRGLVLFMLVCGLGAAANVGIAAMLYRGHLNGALAGAAGALIGVVWNYTISATLVWRRR